MNSVWALAAISLLTTSQALAQMSDASLFSDMKSANPAVISRRPGRIITVVGRSEFTKKEQTLKTANGDEVDADAKTDVNVNTVNFFYGGKGPDLTTEFGAGYVTGTQKDNASTDTETHAVSNNASNYLGYFGLGINENVGFSYTRVGYKSEFKIDDTFAGQPNSAAITTKVEAEEFKVGARKDFGSFSIAGSFMHSIAKPTTSMEGSGTLEQPDSMEENIAGFAMGTSSKTFHLEVGYETALQAKTNTGLGKDLTPARVTGTIEGNFGTFKAGYTGKYFMDGFFDVERVIYNEFVYSNSYAEPRLENTFNFSWGRESGASISASLYYTAFNSNEVNSFFQDGNKVDTMTTSYGAALKFGYAF